VAAIEALVTSWHGQGAVSLPGGVKVERISGRLSLSNP
jgi:tRNA(Ile)-lysidine synthase